jgi:hypothetical protein
MAGKITPDRMIDVLDFIAMALNMSKSIICFWNIKCKIVESKCNYRSKMKVHLHN